MVVSGTRSSWKPVTRHVPQGLTVGPMLLKVFFSDSDDGEQSTLGSLQTTESWEGQYLNTRNDLFTLWLVKQQKRLPTDIAFTGRGPG